MDISSTLQSFPGSPTLQTEVRTRLAWWWRGTAFKTRLMGSGLFLNHDVGTDNLPLLSSYLQVFCRGEHRGSLWTLVPLRRPRLAAQADNWRVLRKWTMQDRLEWFKFVMCLWKLFYGHLKGSLVLLYSDLEQTYKISLGGTLGKISSIVFSHFSETRT